MELIIISGGIVVIPILTFITSVLFWPGALLKAYNWFTRHKLGLVVRYSHSGNYRFCYSTRGTPEGTTPSLLLLHGFSANKDMWLPFIKYFPRNLHLVCVDMPGHEGTSRTGVEDYSIEGQVARIHQFVQSIGLDKRPFHVVGTSMGGNVAGVYAARYAAFLSGATLICPAGLVYPKDSEFISRLKKMENSQQEESIPLIPSTLQEMEDLLSLCLCTSLNFPRPVLRGLLANRLPNNGFLCVLISITTLLFSFSIAGEKSRHSLQENLHLITSPVQVIWGQEDQVVDVSGSTVLQAALPNCQVELLDNCGHSVVLERPRKTAKLIMDFLSVQTGNGENTKKHS